MSQIGFANSLTVSFNPNFGRSSISTLNLLRIQVHIATSKKDQFYFRWLENSIIKIGKAALAPLMFNHSK